MSSENVTTEKKPRTPVLSEKYSKFIQFGYYMMSKMTNNESFSKEDFFNQIQMFATVEEQQTFIQGFFDNQKDNKKAMRKEIQEKKKADKPKKEKVPRKAKKTKATTEENTNNNNTEETPYTTDNISQENLIENITNELTEEPMIDRITTAIEVAKDITAKKPRKKATGEKKPRTNKKSKENKETDELSNAMESLNV